MLKYLHDVSHRARNQQSGFTLIELVVVAAVLALLVALALPSYLGARNKAAIDEANGMAQQWRSLAYGCYLQQLTASACNSDNAIGFNEQPGKYWNWTASPTANGTIGDQYAAGPTSTIVVSWASLNNGLEMNETYIVSMFVSGSQQGQSQATCIPKQC
jgi:prepilin-type N-terminal cleavage/methylation domain-containing protein